MAERQGRHRESERAEQESASDSSTSRTASDRSGRTGWVAGGWVQRCGCVVDGARAPLGANRPEIQTGPRHDPVAVSGHFAMFEKRRAVRNILRAEPQPFARGQRVIQTPLAG